MRRRRRLFAGHWTYCSWLFHDWVSSFVHFLFACKSSFCRVSASISREEFWFVRSGQHRHGWHSASVPLLNLWFPSSWWWNQSASWRAVRAFSRRPAVVWIWLVRILTSSSPVRKAGWSSNVVRSLRSVGWPRWSSSTSFAFLSGGELKRTRDRDDRTGRDRELWQSSLSDETDPRRACWWKRCCTTTKTIRESRRTCELYPLSWTMNPNDHWRARHFRRLSTGHDRSTTTNRLWDETFQSGLFPLTFVVRPESDQVAWGAKDYTIMADIHLERESENSSGQQVATAKQNKE